MKATEHDWFTESPTTAASLADRSGSGRSKPPISRVVLRDYWSFVLALLCAASLISLVGAPALLLLAPLAVRRVQRIRRVLMHGETTTGVVLRRQLRRGEWLIGYGFAAGGQTVSARTYVLGFRLPVRKGDVVSVVYDPAKPADAYLPVLYSAPPRPTPSNSQPS